jgi:hypothetical protein
VVRVSPGNFFAGQVMARIVRLPVPLDSDDHARATNAERTRRLFEWAATVLRNLGLATAVAQATSVAELRGITLNVDGAEVSLAIRDALHPATGDRQDHFHGLREGTLKKILKNRLADLKRDREKVLRRRAGAERDWTDELMLNAKGEIIPNLANLILILRKAPKWAGVLAYDEFNARVIIRRCPPWGKEEVDAPWSDHYETMARAWFKLRRLAPRRAISDEPCRRQQSTTNAIQCASISSLLHGTGCLGSTRG